VGEFIQKGEGIWSVGDASLTGESRNEVLVKLEGTREGPGPSQPALSRRQRNRVVRTKRLQEERGGGGFDAFNPDESQKAKKTADAELLGLLSEKRSSRQQG